MGAAPETSKLRAKVIRAACWSNKDRRRYMSTLPIWLQAGVWGLVAGSALVIGALIGYFTHIPHRVIASIMAFGSGVLISALSFDLVEEAHKRGGFVAAAIGFFAGAAIFTGANLYLAHRGAAARKLSHYAGMIAVVGFLAAYYLSKISG
jgi:hypothetical protein